MPTLDWIGKKAVENHHKEVPYRLLKCVPELSVGEPGSGNLLVQGDNLEALKALLPYYGGKVKCIYIDPPYNTGDENWAYNDAVNSPEMQRWLGEVVGRDDLSRHDKWLSMMYPRISLLTKFLADNSFLFVSLDDIEHARFRLLMEEIAPDIEYITTIIWKSRRNLDNRSLHNVSVDHEYVVAYRKGEARFRGSAKDETKYTNPDGDPRGAWMSDNLVGLATKERRPNLHYDLVNPETGHVYPCPAKGWRYSKETMAQKIVEGRIIWPKKQNGRPRHKKFRSELLSDYAGFSSFLSCGNTNEGTEEVMRIMGEEQFIFPKPRSLVQALIEQTTSNDDIVLDSFSGTGTTAHAVLAQNIMDGMNRRFLLIEMDENICRTLTHKRLEKVISGYTWHSAKGETIEERGLKRGFRFCELGATLFDADGTIHEDVKFADLAHHVFFTEMREPLPKENKGNSPLLGVAKGTAVYLLYNGILKDKDPKEGNVLTMETLKWLPDHEGTKVVYGTACTLGERTLKRHGITFRQIPYEVKAT